MARPNAKAHTTDFNTPTGCKSFDLIFSSDYTGTVDGVAYDGSVDAVQTFDAGEGVFQSSVKVVVTTGNVRVAQTLN